MKEYRTLVVAPKTSLMLVDDEVMQVVNLLGAKLLQGNQANIHGLLGILSEPFDIIWFATHGNEQGILLTPDDEKGTGILEVPELVPLVRSSSTKLLVLNTCSSRSIALGIYDELRIELVCTLKAVPDKTAFITGTLFARKVSEGYSFREAYEVAKPGRNSTYTFLPENERRREKPMPPIDRPEKINTDLNTLSLLVKRLQILVSGDADYNVRGLIPTVRDLEIKIDEIRDEFALMREKQLFDRRLLFTLVTICVMLLMGMAILVFKGSF